MTKTIDNSKLFEPFTLTCCECGGEATSYPFPHPGVVFCPTCSPAWVGDFAQLCTNERIAEREQKVRGIQFTDNMEHIC